MRILIFSTSFLFTKKKFKYYIVLHVIQQFSRRIPNTADISLNFLHDSGKGAGGSNEIIQKYPR